MRKAAGLLVGAVAMATVVALFVILLSETSPGELESTREGQSSTAESSLKLPAAGDAAAPDALAVATDEVPALDAAPPVAVPAEPGVAIRFTGRVVDDLGRPLAGAQVLFVPDARTLAARGWKREALSWLKGHGVAELASTTTGDDGRFALTGRIVRARPGETKVTGGPNPSSLVARAPGFAPYGHEITDDRDAADDVGDLRLVPGGTVAGRVVNERGHALAGAQVRFWVPNGHPRGTRPCDEVEALLQSVVTGDDGRFEVADLPASRLEAEASAQDRPPRRWEAFDLAAGEHRVLEPLTLKSGASVSGVVLDPAGKPLAGADVIAQEFTAQARGQPMQVEYAARRARFSWSSVPRAKSDAAGRFELNGLPGEGRTVIAAAPGLSAAAVHDVPNGAAGLVLRLLEGSVLDVRIIDRNTRLPLEATVEASLRGSAGASGADEKLDVEVVAPGHARVHGAGGQGTALVVTAAGYARAEPEGPRVAPGESGDVLVELDRGLTLAGQVVGPAGEPVAEAAVTLEAPDPEMASELSRLRALGYIGYSGGAGGDEWQSVRTAIAADAEGRFRFEALPAGFYRAAVTAPAHVRTESASVELVADKPAPELVVTLPLAGDVRGLLVDASGQPLPRRSVTLQGATEDDERWSRCDTAGRFAFRDVPPGAYTALANPGGEAPVLVVAGEVAQVRLQVQAVATLLVVVTSAGAPVAGQKVWANPEGVPMSQSQTDAQGRCQFTLPPTPVSVSVNSPGGGVVTQQTELLAGESRTLLMELPAGRIDVLLLEAGTEQPAAGALVGAVRLDDDGQLSEHDQWIEPLEEYRQPVVAGADGRATLEHLQPGHWRVHAGRGGWMNAAPMDIEVGAEPAAATLELRRSPVIRGRVLLPDGRPAAPQTRVLLVLIEGPEPPSEPKGVASTDAEGRFEFGDLDGAGDFVVLVPRGWWLESLHADAVLVQKPVQLAEGQSAEVVLTLPP